MTERQKVMACAALSLVIGLLLTPIPVLRTIVGLAWFINCLLLFSVSKEL